MDDAIICLDGLFIVAAALFAMMSQRHFIEVWYVSLVPSRPFHHSSVDQLLITAIYIL